MRSRPGLLSETGGEHKGKGTHLSREGDKVVLAEAGNVNVAHDDHLVVIFRENCIVDHIYFHGNALVSTFLERLEYGVGKVYAYQLISPHIRVSSTLALGHIAPAF